LKYNEIIEKELTKDKDGYYHGDFTINTEHKYAIVFIGVGWGDMIHPLSMLIGMGMEKIIIMHEFEFTFKVKKSDNETFGNQLVWVLKQFDFCNIKDVLGVKPKNQNEAIQKLTKTKPKLEKFKNVELTPTDQITYQFNRNSEMEWKNVNETFAMAIIKMHHPLCDYKRLTYRNGIRKAYSIMLKSKYHYSYWGSTMWLAFAMGIPMVIMHSSYDIEIMHNHLKYNLSLKNIKDSNIHPLRINRK